jgi:hypothetical protein
MLAAGCWILDAGYWVPATGYRMLDIITVVRRRALGLDLDSLHFMKRCFHHENTNVGRHENYISFFSCFRHFVIS